jgi:hypothetical protein
MEVLQMNKRISPVAKELNEVVLLLEVEVSEQCPEEQQRDPWDDMEVPEGWLGNCIPDDEDLPF